jgi:hypothetical protein
MPGVGFELTISVFVWEKRVHVCSAIAIGGLVFHYHKVTYQIKFNENKISILT